MPIFTIYTVDPSNGYKPGKTLYYNTDTSDLYDDENLHKPELELNKTDKLSPDNPKNKTSPKILKIQLGLSCNYSCEYCSQRFVPHSEETNPGNVDEFINSLDSWVLKEPYKIEFWGGEPLVYIKTLKPLASKLRIKYPNSHFTIITNGSLLTKEINNWLVDMGFNVGISHDGPAQYVRGPDPLDDPQTKEAILDLYNRLSILNRISFNSVLTNKQFSRHAIVKFFQELTGDEDVSIGEGGFIDAYDEGGLANSLTPEQEILYRNTAFREIRAGLAKNMLDANNSLVSFIRSLHNSTKLSEVGQKCGMDREDNITVDLKGNVITCQNVSSASTNPAGTSHHIGTVGDLGSVKLNSATHFSHREECPKCPVVHICKGSCMFLSGPLWEASCNNSFSNAIPYFAAGIEYITGLVPWEVEGPQRSDRKKIWEFDQSKTKNKIIPIKAQ